MKDYFEKQLAATEPITEEQVAKMLKGKSIYGPYQAGEKILFFMEQELIDSEKPTISFNMRTCTNSDFKALEAEYDYVRSAGKEDLIPVLRRK